MGVPVHEDRRLFEFLVLEGAQAGLSWITILRKREGLSRGLCRFRPRSCGPTDEREQERLRENPAIVRNRAKIAATVGNAKAFLAIQREFGSFDDFLWRFVDGAPSSTALNHWRRCQHAPSDPMPSAERYSAAASSLSAAPSVGAYMQAIGMVNDHLTTCFRHPEAH